jgi:hypothetical protein
MRTRENDDLVVSCDEALAEETTNEAVAASNDDSSCHVVSHDTIEEIWVPQDF